jgi:hypothetical protein
MKADISQRETIHPPSEETDARPPQYKNEERILIASFIIGNLIFWGSLFYLFIAELLQNPLM